ncbi:MAG: 50S ribosomal protein L15 [Planctomycetota bacterium]|nr:MAG: 50S ribosomal protein L15 [Planctomycetota bacterium]
MQIGDITKRAGRGAKRKRLGRGPGSGLGKTAGRGHKGAGSRAGWKMRGLAEGGAIPTHRRFPKRGFSNAKFRVEYTVVNVATLEARYESGATVTPESLRDSGLVGHLRNPIKILGFGELKKKLTVEAAKFSKSAEQKITSAGGTVKVVARSVGDHG